MAVLRPGWRARHAGPGQSLAYVCLCTVLGCITQVARAQQACPGLTAGACGPACQQDTCLALDAFFKATHVDGSWNVEDGWELLNSQNCQQLLGSGAVPSYCEWHGLDCCTPAALAQQQCAAVNAVVNVTLPVNHLNGSISAEPFVDALVRLHACGLANLVLDGNDLTGSLSPRLGELTQLTTLDLGTNWLTGTLPEQLGQLQALQRLDLNGNYFYGTLPAWLDTLQRLEVLNLGDSGDANAKGTARGSLQGPLPVGLLRSPQLRELGLDGATLQGGIPDPLCGPNTSVRVIRMRNARLTGRADGVLSCTALSMLDLSHNQLTGPVPASANWSSLQVLRLQSNAFSGNLPAAMWDMPYLAIADISNNRITGTLSRDILVLTYLSVFLASGNRLSGTVPADIFYSPGLTQVRLDNNLLTGTLPATLLYASSLTELSLANNTRLNGTLPAEIGALPLLTTADFTNTNLSCDASGNINGTCEQPLPCFLAFAPYQGPAQSGIVCQAIVRKGAQAASAACPPGMAQLLLVNPLARSDFRWQLNRSYYQYRTCECLPDQIAQYSNNGTEMVCLPGDGSGGGAWWRALLVALFSTFAVLVASYVLTRVLVGARYQPRWLRQQEMRRKRATGPPTSGTVSVVVTDIEGYSELMRYSPSLMTRALGLHNAVIRRASWTHGGHVIEQEGDSFTIAFHEPMDAVSFCLQAQQALMLVDWPAGLGGASEHAEGGSNGGSRTERRSGSRTERRSGSRTELGSKFDFGGHRGDFGGSRADFGSAADLVALERMLNGGSSAYKRARSSVDLPARLQRAERVGSAGSSHGRGAGGSDGAEQPGLSGLEEDASMMGGSFTSHYHSSGSEDEDVGEQPGHQRSSRSFGLIARHPSAGTPSGGPSRPQLTHASSMASRLGSLLLGHLPAPLRGKSNGKMSVDRQGGVPGSGSSNQNDSHHRFFSLFLRPVGADSEMLFYGLRVRMGVATGVLQEGTVLKNSAAVDLAKLVSDAGGGGQVLVEAATFDTIRDRLHELGAVDGRGVNERWLQAGRNLKLLVSPITSWFRRIKLFLVRGMEGTVDDEVFSVQRTDAKSDDGSDDKAVAHSAREAVVLDMGEYEVPGVDAAAATAAALPSERWSLKSSLARNPWQRFSTADNPFTRGSMAGDMGQRRGSADNAMRRQSLSNQPFRRRSVAAGGGDGDGSRGYAPLRLYSVLPPPLVGRAKVWGNTLALKEDTKQVDKAYFDAPGTLYAEVDRAAAATADADAITVVTMVSVAIAGIKGYRRWRRDEEARMLAGMLADCLRQTLAAVPSGYLCREHDDGLRYWVAFPNPQAALQWCLATQEAMMYQPWPASILSFPGFEEVKGLDGRLHFRGPRLKMGVAEGCPRQITPDHMGRAEYHGPCVVQAMRLMECAAQGGQIACELELVQRVFRRWRHEDDFADDSLNFQPSDPLQGAVNGLSPLSSRRGSLEGQLGEPPERANSLSPNWAAMPAWLSKVLPRHDHLHPATAADSTLQIRGSSNTTSFWGAGNSARTSTELVQSPTAMAAAAAAAVAAVPQRSQVDVPSPFAAASMQASNAPALTEEQLQWQRKPGRGKRQVDQGQATAAALQQQQQQQQDGLLKVTSSAPARTTAALAAAQAAEVTTSLPYSAGDGGGSPPERALSEEAQRRLALLFGKTVPASIQPAPSTFPISLVAVEARHLGTFRLKGGGQEASEVVAVSLTRLKGRRFHFDFPKPHTCIQVRDGVADGALCELPDACEGLRKEWEAQQRREEEQRRLEAAAVDREETVQQLRSNYGTAMLRRSMSVLGSRNRTNSMNVRMAVLQKHSEEQQRPDLEEARDQR